MATEIRKAAEADSIAIAELFLAARATMSYLPQLHTDDETRAFVARIVRESDTYVAVREGRVVGFAALRDEWLDHLYVHPSRFNTSTGTKLFVQAQTARPDGFQLWVFQQNTAARRFYERHGCALARLTDGRANEEKLPDALYVWPADRKLSLSG
jgi:ribosomal protein S18 acetylase RimI-like enzyme